MASGALDRLDEEVEAYAADISVLVVFVGGCDELVELELLLHEIY